MARPTFPAVFYDQTRGEFVCEMKDKQTGRVWSRGYGSTAQEAIANARSISPKAGYIRNAIGWVTRHPIIAGSLCGIALGFRDASNNGYHDWRHFAKWAIIGGAAGLAVYIGGKMLKGIFMGIRDATARRKYAT